MSIPVLAQTIPFVPSYDASAAQAIPANPMPSLRQTPFGVEALSASQAQPREHKRQPATIIRHPRFSPSAVTSEQYIAARAMLSPGFLHQAAATQIARISNLYADTPRFSQQVDILA